MENQMMSLYDYLGRAAGSGLGEQVARKATLMKVKMDTRYVKNPVYEGNVMLYPKSFLDEYFKAVQEKNLASLYEDDDDLPF